MKASQIRTHDDPPALVMDEKEKSAELYAAPKDKARISRFGIFVIGLGCKISGIEFLR